MDYHEAASAKHDFGLESNPQSPPATLRLKLLAATLQRQPRILLFGCSTVTRKFALQIL